jgi:hypothetical protein
MFKVTTKRRLIGEVPIHQMSISTPPDTNSQRCSKPIHTRGKKHRWRHTSSFPSISKKGGKKERKKHTMSWLRSKHITNCLTRRISGKTKSKVTGTQASVEEIHGSDILSRLERCSPTSNHFIRNRLREIYDFSDAVSLYVDLSCPRCLVLTSRILLMGTRILEEH